MMRYFAMAMACSLAWGSVSLAQPAPTARSGASAGPRDQVICRRLLRIGTLSSYYRVCKTRAEWQREQEERNQISRDYPTRCNAPASSGMIPPAC